MNETVSTFAARLKQEMIPGGSAEIDLFPATSRPPVNPKILEIVKTLEADPLLIEPTRRFLGRKIREINGAKLSILYSESELQELKEKL